MKRIFSFLLIGFLLCSGCGTSSTVSLPSSSPSAVSSAFTYTAPVTDGTYQIQEHSIETDAGRIYGEIYLPGSKDQVYPTVILAHGIGGNHKDLELFADWFAEEGYCAYIFDFIGGGYDIQSDGTMMDMSVLTEERDLENIIHDLSSLSYVDQDRLFLVGQSQGGYVSSLTAARNPEKIRGLMLLYPAFSIQHDVQERYGQGETIPASAEIFTMTVSRKYFEDVLATDIYSEIENYDGDVLAFQGDSDTIAPVEYTEEAMKHFPHGVLEIEPGANHGFVLEVSQQIQKLFHTFVEEHLKERNVQEKLWTLQNT